MTDPLGEPDNPWTESSGIKMMEPRAPIAVGALILQSLLEFTVLRLVVKRELWQLSDSVY